VFWQALVTLRDDTVIELMSGTEIRARMFEATRTAVFDTEFDTVGVPFDQLKCFHIWERGVQH
jgi:hypothetical protein